MSAAPTLLALMGLSSMATTPAELPPLARQPTLGYYSVMLGDWQITAVSDGSVAVAFDKLLTNIAPHKLRQYLGEEAKISAAQTAINAFVINTGSRLILVDSGAGALFGQAGGHLPDNLRAAGIPPENIDLVLLTHIHADHSGGVSWQGKLVFPNATVRVAQQDVDLWLNPANSHQVGQNQQHVFAQSERSLRPIIRAGKLHTFNAPQEIIPGIEAIAAAGHTPGSVMYRVTRGGKTLLLWGDIVHAAAVQMPEPHVAIHFDVDQKQAIATRERVLKQVAERGDWVAAAHIAFPGIGQVKAAGRGYRWVPVDDAGL